MRKQKLLAVLLALVMVATLLPLTALASPSGDGKHIATTYYLSNLGSGYASSTNQTPLAIFKFDAAPSTSSYKSSLCDDSTFESGSYYFICTKTSGQTPLLDLYSNGGSPAIGVGTRYVYPTPNTEYRDRNGTTRQFYASTVLRIEPADGESGKYTIRGNTNSTYYLSYSGSTLTAVNDKDKAGTFDIVKTGTTGMYYISWSIDAEVETDVPQTSGFVDHTKNYPPSGTTNNQPFVANQPSGNYRIPSMITTTDGVIVTACDARWNQAGDGANLDTIVAYSTDNGTTWTHVFANYFDDSTDAKADLATSFIDPAMVQDPATGTIYLLVDIWPGGVALNTSPNKPATGDNGYRDIEGESEKRLVLFNSPVPTSQSTNGWTHWVGEFAYNSTYKANFAPVFPKGSTADSEPQYYVDEWYYIYDKNYVPVLCYQLGSSKMVQANIFFYNDGYSKDSGSIDVRLHVRGTSHLWLVTSNDNGKTWSAPALLNSMVRVNESATDGFYGVGPGRGLVTADGTIMFSLYTFYNNGGWADHCTSIITSTDGKNWTKSTAVDYQTSEGTMVEVGDTLYLFCRHGCAFTSKDKGQSWTYKNSLWPTGLYKSCQIDTMVYSMKVDGKTAILLSGPKSSGRSNGTLFVGLVNEETGSIEWKTSYQKTYQSGSHQYSCLTQLDNGKVAVLCEPFSGSPAKVTYQVIDLEEFLTQAGAVVTPPDITDDEMAQVTVNVTCENEFHKDSDSKTQSFELTTDGGAARLDGDVTKGDDGIYTCTVTVEPTQFLAKYTGTEEDAHNLTAAASADLTVTFSYNNITQTWVPKDDTVTITVECEAKPDFTEDDVLNSGVKVNVTDTTTDESKEYDIEANTFEIQSVNKTGEGYSVEVTVDLQQYADKYAGEIGLEVEAVDPTNETITFTYNKETSSWDAGTTSIEVSVASQSAVTPPPTPPTPPTPPSTVTPPADDDDTELPDDDVPMNPTPDDGDTDVDEGDTPLAPAPDDTDIPDGDTPLDSTPKTGDTSIAIAVLWSIFSMSAVGFVWVVLSMKKSGKHSK